MIIERGKIKMLLVNRQYQQGSQPLCEDLSIRSHRGYTTRNCIFSKNNLTGKIKRSKGSLMLTVRMVDTLVVRQLVVECSLRTFISPLVGRLSWLEHHPDTPRLWVQFQIRAQRRTNQ